MLSLHNITYDLPNGDRLIDDISLDIQPGKMTVITGPNGGGKTSLAKIIAGLYVPTSGNIVLNDEDITSMSITDRARKGIAYAFQQPVSFKGLSVRQLMEIAAGEAMPEIKMCKILEKVGLCAREYMDRQMDSHLSGGEMKRIEIATVLARDAQYVVFDEPEAGIDLWSFSSLIDAFKNLKNSEDRALLIISHQERILNIADYIAVVADGRISSYGEAGEIYPGLVGGTITPRCPMGKEIC